MAFFTILTNVGQAKIANAVALGQQIQVTEMALGDDAGTVLYTVSGNSSSNTIINGELAEGGAGIII